MRLLRGHWQLIAITVLVFALWRTPAVLPLKILVVFLHELSHALAALLTGGRVDQIALSPQQGGFAITRGGNVFLILTAGYLGSLFLGALILLLALRTQADRLLMAGLGATMLLVAALYMRTLFGLAFCAATGAAMLATAWFLGRRANDFVLRVIGVTSVIYVPYDIFSDTIARSSLRSDAYMLAERVGGTAALWGALWLLVSVAVIWLCLRHALGRESNL